MRIRLDYGSWHGHPLRDITYFLGRLLREQSVANAQQWWYDPSDKEGHHLKP